MDFIDLDRELSKVRVFFHSNEMSSAIYVEELPDYSRDAVKALNLYFYFRGDKHLDLISLFNDICIMDASYDEIRDFSLSQCESIDKDEFSYSEKDVSPFSVKPHFGYRKEVIGTDFKGFSAWNHFIFVRNGKVCLSDDQSSARKLFILIHKEPSLLTGKNYVFLINKLKDEGFKFYTGENPWKILASKQ